MKSKKEELLYNEVDIADSSRLYNIYKEALAHNYTTTLEKVLKKDSNIIHIANFYYSDFESVAVLHKYYKDNLKKNPEDLYAVFHQSVIYNDIKKTKLILDNYDIKSDVVINIINKIYSGVGHNTVYDKMINYLISYKNCRSLYLSQLAEVDRVLFNIDENYSLTLIKKVAEVDSNTFNYAYTKKLLSQSIIKNQYKVFDYILDNIREIPDNNLLIDKAICNYLLKKSRDSKDNSYVLKKLLQKSKEISTSKAHYISLNIVKDYLNGDPNKKREPIKIDNKIAEVDIK
jgi:hypothetical protein